MYFLLHHSTGTLMLEAHDRGSVSAWSERQFGATAKRVAIVELDGDAAHKRVEKSGTGIQLFGCEPFFSIMADSTERLLEAKIGEVHFAGHLMDADFEKYRFSIH
jgi:hypothetical protein